MLLFLSSNITSSIVPKLKMFTIEPLTSPLARKIESDLVRNLVKISDGENFFIFTQKYADKYLEKIKKFKVYEDDVWVVTYPKCGTTWTQEMVRMLSNNMDYEAAKTNLDEEFPFIEQEIILFSIITTDFSLLL